MSAMCRKCLKTASDEARRCSSCGGRVVRFSESGEVIDIEATAEEPIKVGGVPALFENIETHYEVTVPAANGSGLQMAAASAQSSYGAPLATAVAGTSFGGAVGIAGAPPNGYCQPSSQGGQPDAGMYAQPLNGHYQAVPGATEHHGLAPPLPMGYSEMDRPAAPPRAAEPAAAFLLPVTQLDDVVGDILTPFGFERPAPVIETPPGPPPFLVDPQHILDQPPAPEPQAVPQPAVSPQPQVAPQPQVVPQPEVSPQPQVAPPVAAAPPPMVAASPVAEAVSAPSQTVMPRTMPAAGLGAPSVAPVIEPVVAYEATAVQPVEQAPASEQSVPGPDLITSSAEPRNKKERQRKEREVSMAELARDIISISEQEPVTVDSAGSDSESQVGGAGEDAARHASFDLVIGPAPKSGRLRRSKIPIPKDAADELADLVADSGLDNKMAESGADKGRRSRLRHR